MSSNTEDRLRAALAAKAGQVTPGALRPGRPPDSELPHRTGSTRRAPWVAPLLAAAAVIGVIIGTAAIVNLPSTHRIAPAGSTNSVVPSPSDSDSASPTETGAPGPGRTPVTTASIRRPPTPSARSAARERECAFADFGCTVGADWVFLEPLWPFPNYAAAKAWLAASKSGGHQPWHAQAGQTALLFTQNYLGFGDITMVTSTQFDEHGARIGVGYRQPDGQLHTAAVLHLVRYSPTIGDSTAGWEVVGSEDTDLSLEQPTYGSQVNSPMTVGGHITGVDENIVVAVRNQSGVVVSGTSDGLPAGGQNSPWQLSVSFQASGVLTVVAFTGGHLAQHERFAIQGVHA